MSVHMYIPSIHEQFFFPELDAWSDGRAMVSRTRHTIAPFDPDAPEMAFDKHEAQVIIEMVMGPSIALLAAERFPQDPTFHANALEIAVFMALAASKYTGPFDICAWMAVHAPRKFFREHDKNFNVYTLSVGVFSFMVMGTIHYGHELVVAGGGYAKNFASIFRFSYLGGCSQGVGSARGQNIICIVAQMMADMSAAWPTGSMRRMHTELCKLNVPASWWDALPALLAQSD